MRNGRSFSALSAGAYITTWLVMVTLSPTVYVCAANFIALLNLLKGKV